MEQHFLKQEKFIEAQRIRERTSFDLEMIQEIGFCKGIENYSRHLEGRSEEVHRPHCFIIYLTTEWFF